MREQRSTSDWPGSVGEGTLRCESRADGLPPGRSAAVAPFDEAWPQPWDRPISGVAR